jgi:hypothetical protein
MNVSIQHKEEINLTIQLYSNKIKLNMSYNMQNKCKFYIALCLLYPSKLHKITLQISQNYKKCSFVYYYRPPMSRFPFLCRYIVIN